MIHLAWVTTYAFVWIFNVQFVHVQQFCKCRIYKRVMIYKPANLIYRVDDKSHLSATLALGFQQVMILFISVILPTIIHC